MEKKKKLIITLLCISLFAVASKVLAAEWHRKGSYVKNVENWHQLTYTGSVRAKKVTRWHRLRIIETVVI